MAVLTKPEILKQIDSGRIKIEPFNPDFVGPASIDFHLAHTFRIFKQIKGSFIVDEQPNYHQVTELIRVKDSLTLQPGESAHGITVESLELPDDLCGWIQGRSTLARIGLMVHVTANFIHPGTHGQQVLEMTNAGPMPLTIMVGIPICQIILEETKGSAQYTGRFFKQKTP